MYHNVYWDNILSHNWKTKAAFTRNLARQQKRFPLTFNQPFLLCVACLSLLVSAAMKNKAKTGKETWAVAEVETGSTFSVAVVHSMLQLPITSFGDLSPTQLNCNQRVLIRQWDGSQACLVLSQSQNFCEPGFKVVWTWSKTVRWSKKLMSNR